jgi:hypothetical protein
MAKKSLLVEASKLVDGVRDTQYGLPHENWGDTAEMMTAYLHATKKLPRDQILDAHDAAMLMIFVKGAREGNMRQRDNLLDIAGYARVIERCDQGE